MPVRESVIPLIDFADFGDGSSEDARAIGHRFYTACRDVGFAYLINHGVSESEIDEMFDWSKKFFDLPKEAKMSAPHPPGGEHHRGYSAVGVEQVSQMVFDEEKLAEMRGKGADFKESYDMGNENSAKSPNIWFQEELLPGFRESAMRFFDKCRQTQMMVLKALAIGMPGVEADFFESFHQSADNQLRLLHYPSAPRRDFDEGEKGRINAHTDFSTCTLLFQDSCGGLEVEDPRHPGVYIPAPPVKGAIIFNIGDFLMRWSNDELKSTLHRVVAPAPSDEYETVTPERYSIPYFISADAGTLIDAIPGTWSEARPKKYRPITSHEYVNMRMNATYVEGIAKLKGKVVY